MKIFTSYIISLTSIFIYSICADEIQLNHAQSKDLVFVKDNEINEDQFNKVDEIHVSDEVFVPTTEWQTVKKDQGIPRGLHVRLNIQTGEKEAKLLDGEHSDKSEKSKTAYDKLKKSLENMNDESLDKSKHIDMKDTENLYRSYNELKEDLKKADLNVLSDSEIINQLIKNLNSSTDKQQTLEILDDLEYHAHKFDNGLVLCDYGGFNLLVSLLNVSQDIELKSQYAHVLGSALQSNSYVKIHALESSLLQLILNQIVDASQTENSRTHVFISRLIFSLSGLLRNFPLAQEKFLLYGGIETLDEVLKNTNLPIKLKTKILTLINNLIIERNELINSENTLSKKPGDGQEHSSIDLIKKLVGINWCDHFKETLSAATDTDTFEKLLNAITSLASDCKAQFQVFMSDLAKLEMKFMKMSEANEEKNSDDYFRELTNKIRTISTILN